MRLSTANHNAKRRQMKVSKREAYEYDMLRIERLTASGRLDKRSNSGFVRRCLARSKARRALA